jgi:hypothetical protein
VAFMILRILIIMSLIFLAGGCDRCRSDDPVNETNRKAVTTSYDNAYTAGIKAVPLNKGGFKSFWSIEIKNREGATIVKNNESFPAMFNIYWKWDSGNRLWIYNSDDNKVYYFLCLENLCGFNFWGWGRKSMYITGKQGEEINPPEGLFPEYVKKLEE